MKVCSFIPAVTQMIYDMGLQDRLYGVTFECPAQARAEKAVLVHCLWEGRELNGEEIDRLYRAAKASGQSIYWVEEELLQAIAPDVIFTQDVCEVCQIDTRCTAAAVARLPKPPRLVSISPADLDEVFQSAITIAREMGREEAAYRYLSRLKQHQDEILETLYRHRMPLRKVALLEWLQPMYNCGHWIPFQIACAGGIDLLSHPRGDSIVLPFEKLVKYDPEVIVLAPCGYTVEQTQAELNRLWQQPDSFLHHEAWQRLQAVQNQQIYLADFDLFTQPSASTIVDGIRLLAALFHPELFDMPAHLQHKHQPLKHLPIPVC
ncbi:ABC transporter substrate-binding protein [Thermoflavifilum thermophilum]|uniref:Iron complex transport system substrate-binding protein n=1 Tax=Thermoflavifilum thermophilum TaxID=1393122 RepID=A0A1I7NF46_9BACT|nr:ABC transporter substrate-binding protein [Thermoflavifilum thermophilum]SFV33278.1 iron complex transport system substrate-binding protein [Thermoflavifilum thermophilum]